MENLKIYRHPENFAFENGRTIRHLEIGYQTFGQLNEDKSNVVWVCHALTANSDVMDWWKGLFGPSDLFSPEKYFIICANNLGSCYGSTGPHIAAPESNKAPLLQFPKYTIRDMANVLDILRIHLDIPSIHTLIGGSMGGQIAQEWIISQPNLASHLILLATNAKHSAWGIAFNESQRLALMADSTFIGETPEGGKEGLKAARSIGLLSYRTYETYHLTQEDHDDTKTENFKASNYQIYQGTKLVQRFDPYAYYFLTLAMDSHNLARNRNAKLSHILSNIKAKTLVISIDTDMLFPIEEQAFLAVSIPNAQHEIIHSDYGHDGFLIETVKISKVIRKFLVTQQVEITI